jgi:hypothetical protein
MSHAAEDSTIGKPDFDCLILGGMEKTGLSQILFHDSRAFGFVPLVSTEGWKFSRKPMPIYAQLIAQNEDADLEHK